MLMRNAFKHLLFALFLFYFIFCRARVDVHANGNTTPIKSVVIFAPRKTDISKKLRYQRSVSDVMHFDSPFIIGTNGLVVVFAAADYTENSRENVDIVARYVEARGTNWAEGAIADNLKKWRTQIVLRNEKERGCAYALQKPLAVAKGNKIYLFVLNHKGTQSVPGNWKRPAWHLEMVVGDVVRRGDRAQGTGKTIEWRTSAVSGASLTQQLRRHSLNVLPYSGSAFLTDDGKIVFVVRAVKANDYFAVIIYLNDDYKNAELSLTYIRSFAGCYPLSVFPWRRKLLMTILCKGGWQQVKESIDTGKTWKESTEPVARVLSSLRNNEYFATAVIQKRTVLLFTRQKIKESGSNRTREIYLWLSDDYRVYDLGPIIIDDNYLVSIGLVYTNGELFFLLQQLDNMSKKTILIHLKEHMEKAKRLLNALVETDVYLSLACKPTNTQGSFLKILCDTPLPTDGLVGFLSGKGDKDVWQDEYFFANATVKRGKKVSNGFTFDGFGAGAQWRLNTQEGYQLYNFTKYGLSVAATVTIHGEDKNGDSSPLLTIGGVDSSERPGLWYSREMKWKMVSRNGWALADTFVKHRAYHVVLMLHNNSIFAYVNGALIGTLSQISAPWEKSFDIEKLFIGGYNDDDDNFDYVKRRASYATIRNILLYNRPLTAGELEALGKRGLRL